MGSGGKTMGVARKLSFAGRERCRGPAGRASDGPAFFL